MAREDGAFRQLRMRPKDLGVALVVLVALGLALLLRARAEGTMRVFQSEDTPLQLSYPAAWRNVGLLPDALLHVEDSLVDSEFKTTFTVENRELDPASAPSLQELVDRRINERSGLLGYHFINSSPATIDGAEALRLDYAYVVQPIDEPRRPSLPVVVEAREYIIRDGAQSYYLTLAAPEISYERDQAKLEQIIRSVRLRPPT